MSKNGSDIMAWMVRDWNWPYLALFGSLVGVALLFPISSLIGYAWTLLFLQMPIYMLHQFEEHDEDRFRLYANKLFGKEVLSRRATFLINSIGVWGIQLLSFYSACFLSAGLGLIAIYLTVVNGVLHLVPALRQRQYNPGLATAVLFFLPLGVFSLMEFSKTTSATPQEHLLAGLVSVLIHLGIIGYVRSQLHKV